MCHLEIFTEGTAILALQCNVNEKKYFGEQVIMSGQPCHVFEELGSILALL